MRGSTSPARTGWHCSACNRYFQTTGTEPPPRCWYCGATGTLRRIGHERPPVDVRVGDVVAADVLGGTEEYVVGTVTGWSGDRVLVEARNGTGQYAVKPEQIVRTRTPR